MSATTHDDSATARLFGEEVPDDVYGPMIEREGLAHGVITRFLKSEVRGKDRKVVHVFQLPTPDGLCFSLWGTAKLNGKIRQIKKGAVVLLKYDGQSDDEDRVHLWTMKPYVGSGREFAALLKSEPWPVVLATFGECIRRAAQDERKRRAALGDGAPPHDDADAPGWGRGL